MLYIYPDVAQFAARQGLDAALAGKSRDSNQYRKFKKDDDTRMADYWDSGFSFGKLHLAGESPESIDEIMRA